MPLERTAQYLFQVIPAQALSEINNQEQFSSLYVLHSLGASESAALIISKLNYAVALVVGIAVGRATASRFGMEMLVFAPIAFVMIGGPYMHVTQMAAALPAALVLIARSPSKEARIGTVLLAVPWINFVSDVTILPVIGMVMFVLLRRAANQRVVPAILFAALAVAAEMVAALVITAAPQTQMGGIGSAAPGSLAEVMWKAVVDERLHDHVGLSLLAKLPTIVGLIAVAAGLLRAAVHPYSAGGRLLPYFWKRTGTQLSASRS
jgi:hypothetical protein